MKRDINYYNFYVGEGREEYRPNNELTWNTIYRRLECKCDKSF